MRAASLVRTYFFLACVLKNQQRDPFCGSCKAFVNSVLSVRLNLAEFEGKHTSDIQSLPSEFHAILSDAQNILSEIVLPENAPGQKRAGNCKLPQGVCLIKSSLAMLQHV